MQKKDLKKKKLIWMKKEDKGYEFDLHGEEGETGHYISAIDSGGVADSAGLAIGDRVVEVNE